MCGCIHYNRHTSLDVKLLAPVPHHSQSTTFSFNIKFTRLTITNPLTKQQFVSSAVERCNKLPQSLGGTDGQLHKALGNLLHS